MMLSRISFVCAALVAIVAVACDTMPLTAPSGSALTISAGSTFVPTGGTTEITAFVLEASGTAVQNGTTVHFSTNLGRVDPIDALTTNGYAVATFMAGDSSGVADVTATSGGTGADDSSEHRQWEWRDEYAVHDKQQRCANHRRRRARRRSVSHECIAFQCAASRRDRDDVAAVTAPTVADWRNLPVNVQRRSRYALGSTVVKLTATVKRGSS